MGKRVLSGSAGLVCLVLGLVSCTNQAQNPFEQLTDGKEISIDWKTESKEMNSYAANVSVYKMNNREDKQFALDSKYRLSTKLVNGEQYTRLDMNDKSPDGRFRSIVTSEKEMVLFDTESEEVQYRLPVGTVSNDFAFIQDGLGFGKVDLDLVKAEAARLSFDVSEDDKKSNMIIALSGELFSSDYSERISTRMSFDMSTDLMTSVELVDIRADGSKVTTTTEFCYQKCDEEYVKVGMITTIDTKYEKRLEGISEDIEYYESMDEIPEISQEDLKKMQECGNIFEDTSIKFGDPADLSSVVTIVEVYEDIEINKTDDSVFKLLGKF